MKHLILISTIIFLSAMNSAAQDSSKSVSPAKTYTVDSTMFLKGKKLHKQGGLMMIFGGASMGVGLAAIIVTYAAGDNEGGYIVGGIMFFGGAGVFLTGIPLAIIGRSKMANSKVKLTLQQIRTQPLPKYNLSTMAIGFSFDL